MTSLGHLSRESPMRRGGTHIVASKEHDNLIPNPRAGDGPDYGDLWTGTQWGWTEATVTSGSATAFQLFRNANHPSYPHPDGDYDVLRVIATPAVIGVSFSGEVVSDPITVGGDQKVVLGGWLNGYGDTYSGHTVDEFFTLTMRYYDSGDGLLTEEGWGWTAFPEVEDTWVRMPEAGLESWNDCGFTTHTDTSYARVAINYTGAYSAQAYFTLLSLDSVGLSYEYGDGSFDGWEWTGTAHNSASQEVTANVSASLGHLQRVA